MVLSSDHVSFPNVFGHLKDQDVNGRLTSKWTLRKQDGGRGLEALDRDEGGRAFVGTLTTSILQKFYAVHIHLLCIISNNCTFAIKYVTWIIIYIPLNVSLLISHIQGTSNTKGKKDTY